MQNQLSLSMSLTLKSHSTKLCLCSLLLVIVSSFRFPLGKKDSLVFFRKSISMIFILRSIHASGTGCKHKIAPPARHSPSRPTPTCAVAARPAIRSKLAGCEASSVCASGALRVDGMLMAELVANVVCGGRLPFQTFIFFAFVAAM